MFTVLYIVSRNNTSMLKNKDCQTNDDIFIQQITVLPPKYVITKEMLTRMFDKAWALENGPELNIST